MRPSVFGASVTIVSTLLCLAQCSGAKSWTRRKQTIGKQILDGLLEKTTILLRPANGGLAEQSDDCAKDTVGSLTSLFSATGGPFWRNSSGWKASDSHCCSWFGIECQQGRVTGLNLSDNNLTGPVPERFAASSSLQEYLTYVNLSSSRIKTLPENIGLLAQLVALDVSQNSGSLNLPASLGNTSLVYLHVGNGTKHPPYEGVGLVTVPESLCKLQKLQYLDLNHNSLDGMLPAGIFNLPLLEVLDLGLGSVGIEFPASGFSGIPNLRYLDLTYNLIGEIPGNLGKLRRLEHLSVQSMPGVFYGSIPDSIGQLSELVYLSFAQNYNMKGPVPVTIWNLTKLEYMDISYNGVAGSWPSTFSGHKSLVYLEMGDMLFGHLPDILGQLTSLTHFGIRTNQLTGPLPPSMGNLRKLEFYNVAGNYLNGTIPESYRSFLPHLKPYSCQMDSNDFACPIPSFVPPSCQATCT